MEDNSIRDIFVFALAKRNQNFPVWFQKPMGIKRKQRLSYYRNVISGCYRKAYRTLLYACNSHTGVIRTYRRKVVCNQTGVSIRKVIKRLFAPQVCLVQAGGNHITEPFLCEFSVFFVGDSYPLVRSLHNFDGSFTLFQQVVHNVGK